MLASGTGRLALLVVMGSILTACGGEDTFDPYVESEDGLSVCAGASTVEGIDVSVWQGTVNWTSVAKAGKKFAVARVSDGLSVDTKFSTNWAAIKKAGLIRGAYQFFRPKTDAVSQANLFATQVGKLGPGDLPPVLDVEVTDGTTKSQMSTAIQKWVTTVKSKTGRTPIVYTGSYFWDASVGSTAFASNPLWIPAYSTTCPKMPAPWTKWFFHQYSQSGSVSGISGAVDLDRFNGTLTDLQHLAGM